MQRFGRDRAQQLDQVQDLAQHQRQQLGRDRTQQLDLAQDLVQRQRRQLGRLVTAGQQSTARGSSPWPGPAVDQVQRLDRDRAQQLDLAQDPVHCQRRQLGRVATGPQRDSP
ncbi:MAG: hypothetical protein V4795_12600 [Pseudomonadota bacterium]